MMVDKPQKGFLYWGIAMLLISLLGFWPGYFNPVLNQSFVSPIKFIHWHAAVVFIWVLLLVIQPLLIVKKNTKLHQAIGLFGVLVAASVVYTSWQVQIQFMHHYFNLGEWVHAVKVPFFRLITLLVFTVCVFLSLVVKDRSWHKRLIFLGSFAVLEAAFARVFLNHLNVFELSGLLGTLTHIGVMVYFVFWDRITLGRFHQASLWGAAVIIVLIIGTAPLADSQWWFELAQSMAKSASE